jgi:hypothetical protein
MKDAAANSQSPDVDCYAALSLQNDSLAAKLDAARRFVAIRRFDGKRPCPARPAFPPRVGLDRQLAFRVVPAEADPRRLRIRAVAIGEAPAGIGRDFPPCSGRLEPLQLSG